jgi:hypothetical protein
VQRGGARAAIERWVPWLLMLAVVAVFGRYLATPPLAAPDAKLAAALIKFDGLQDLLARSLCGRPPFLPGALGFRETGVTPGPMLHKAHPGLSVRVSVEATAPDTVRLTLVMPELTADGIHWLAKAEPVPAGAELTSEGRCVDGRLYWGPLRSSLHRDRIDAARWRGAD